MMRQTDIKRATKASLQALTVQVADFAVLDCWKDTSKVWGPA